MNEMRKLMEAMGSDDAVMELEDIYNDLQDCIGALADAIRRLPNENDRERGRRMVVSHFQTALNSDHGWLGGNMTTLRDFIEELRGNENYEG